MKYRYFFLLIFCFSLNVNAQNKLKNIDKSNLETSILVPISTLHNINKYQQNTNSSHSFLQTYNLIKAGDFNNRFPAINEKELRYATENQVVPIGILNVDFENIKPEAFSDGRIALDANQNIINTTGNNSVFNKNTISIAAPLFLKHKGLKTKFILNDQNIYNTTNKQIASVSINFGNGFINLPFNQAITIEFETAGSKTLDTKILFTDGSSSISKSTIDIVLSATDLNRQQNMAITTFNSTITPDLTAYGEAANFGTGEYDIYLSSDNILDKPIIVCDGFDPSDSRDIPAIYSLLDFTYDNGTFSNLGDEMRTEGFDIVVLNFPVYTRASDGVTIDGGVDFIERNAMLLVELINIINAQKVGIEENVIIGPSMGGLISRFALNYMENQNMPHDTRLWISFDSPQQGANVPIGFQSLFNRLAYGLDVGGLGGDQSIVSIQPIIDGMLKSPAARQMLLDQFEAHLAAGSDVDFDPTILLPTPHPFHSVFYNSLNSLTTSGYPESVRKVSIINGSGINARYPDKTGADILPDREILNTFIPDVATGTDATFKVRLTPYNSTTNEVSYIFLDLPWYCFCGDFTNTADSQAFNYTDGIDAASGGLFDLGGLSGSLGDDPTINAFFNALQIDYFNFIPTVSAMALQITNNEVNWYHTPTNLVTGRLAVNNITPFDNWYMPDSNEPHVTLTEPNVAFAKNEINPTSLSTNLFEENKLTLVKNPIKNTIILNSNKDIKNAKITVTDITGKILLSTTKNISQNTNIPENFASGVYLLSVTENTNALGQFKIVVE